MPTGPEGSRRLVLDTSAYSWFRAGHREVLRLATSAEIVLVPCVVIGELEAGFALGRRPRENQMLLQEFLSEAFVSVLPVTQGVARQYGRIRAALQAAGTPIPINDVWIGATTLDCGGCLVTFDQHFESIAGLEALILRPE